MLIFTCYRLPTKLQEGNVSTAVCHSVQGESRAVLPRDHVLQDLTVQGHVTSGPYPLQMLTSGGFCSTYGGWGAGTHPTEMLSCYFLFWYKSLSWEIHYYTFCLLFVMFENNTSTNGGSRISQTGCVNRLEGTLSYYLATFLPKTLKNERNWTERGRPP